MAPDPSQEAEPAEDRELVEPPYDPVLERAALEDAEERRAQHTQLVLLPRPAAEPKSAGEPESTGEPECAVDDTGEASTQFVLLQRSEKQQAEQKHQAEQKQRENRAKVDYLIVQEIVPFRFIPNFLPLRPADWASCVALENAAFTNPEFRCSPEKVSAL